MSSELLRIDAAGRGGDAKLAEQPLAGTEPHVVAGEVYRKAVVGRLTQCLKVAARVDERTTTVDEFGIPQTGT